MIAGSALPSGTRQRGGGFGFGNIDTVDTHGQGQVYVVL